MSKERSKTKKIGKYLPIACVLIMLLPTMNVCASPLNYVLQMPSLSSVLNTVQSMDTDQSASDYGFVGDGVSDGFQTRQSEYLVTRSIGQNGRLNGISELVLLYFPVTDKHFSLDIVGSTFWVFQDGSSFSGPWHRHVEWWSIGLSFPDLGIMGIKVTSSKAVKSIFIDVDYVEDGLLVRHIQKVFNNMGSSDEASAPVVLSDASVLMNGLMENVLSN